MLNVILCARPELLYTAQKTALAKHFEVIATEEGLPSTLESESPLRSKKATRPNETKINKIQPN
jgi:hypothetical protein